MKEEIKQTILSKLHNTSHLEEMTKPYQELAKVKFRVLADELAEEISGQFEREVIQNEHTEGSSANGLAAYRPFNLNYVELQQCLKDNNELLEDLFNILHKDIIQKEIVIKSYQNNLKAGGSIKRITEMQKRNNKLSQKYL